MDRKKFLITTSLSILGLNLVSSKTVTTDFLFIENKSPLDIKLLLKKAADLRKNRLANNSGANTKTMSRRSFFFRSNNSNISATSVYRVYDQIIDQNPTEIRAYNGKRKALLQDGANISDVIEMYEEANLNNPNSAEIRERLAKEYYRVLTGNKQALSNLSGSYRDKEQLLFVVEHYLQLANQIDGINSQYITQLERINTLKEINFFTSDSRTNSALKLRKQIFKLESGNAFKKMTISELESSRLRLANKEFEVNRAKKIVKLEKQAIRVMHKQKNYEEAVARATAFYYANNEDPDGLKLVRNTLKKNKRFDLLEKIEIENDKNKNTFWSKMTLCDVLLKRKRLERKVNDLDCIAVLKELKKLIRNDRERFEFMIRDIAFKLYTNSSDVEMVLLKLAKYAEGIDNNYITYKVSQLSVEFLMKNNKKEEAMLSINMALGTINQYDGSDSLLVQLFVNSQYRKTVSLEQKRDLEILRDRLLT